MSSLTLQLICFSTHKFAGATDAERRFLLAGGHLHNEIVVLNKLMVWMMGPSSNETSIDRSIRALQAMTTARILAGKLSEGWRLVEVAYFGSKLSADPALNLEPQPTDALKFLKRYFNGKNTVRLLRDDFAFHYSSEKIAECWQELQKEEGFDLIVGDTLGNTFHRAAEFAANLAMLKAIHPTDRGAALNHVFENVGNVARNFSTFVDGVIHSILARLNALESTEAATIDGLQKFKEVAIPFFTNMPGDEADERK